MGLRGQMRTLLPDVFEFNDRFQVAYRQKDPNPAAEILATSLCSSKLKREPMLTMGYISAGQSEHRNKAIFLVARGA